MSSIIIGTDRVKMDEPCLMLAEYDKAKERYQLIRVMRNDTSVEFTRKLGKSKNFVGSQFNIPGGCKDEVTGRWFIEHTVGELIDMANYLRERPLPKPQGTDLLGQWAREQEEKKKLIV
jgi:hypothetical protein